MPRRQAEVEQGGNLHRLEQADGVERKALAIRKLTEMLLAPGGQILCRPLAVGRLAR